MKLLVADTSSSVCAVGIFDSDKLINENCIDNGKTHSENFMPLMKKTLEEAKVSLDEIDCIGVVVGPGSFTGIRIGVASSKAIAEVKRLKLISISSLESLAANEINQEEHICSLIDARNDQVYCGIFDKDINNEIEFLADSIENVIKKIKKYNNIIFVGNGAEIHKDFIIKQMKGKKISFSKNNKQNVNSLGIIAYKKALKGEFISADEIIPIYLRKSQAERSKNRD